jgi:outer membrane protein OmpA-like peptidoglycan-associated protein
MKKSKVPKPTQEKRKPAVHEEPAAEETDLTQLPGAPGVKLSGTATEGQAARLADPRLSAVQRRALAAEIGRLQGNRRLQRVVASARAGDSALPAQRQDAEGREHQPQAQPDPNRAGPALSALPSRGPLIVQRDLMGSYPTAQGGFEIGMQTKEGAPTGAGASGMRGTIKFLPGADSPYSNKIGLVQIVKITDAGGANVSPVSLPATTAPHVRTAEDKAFGVEKGFFTDVLHQDPFSAPGKAPKVAGPGAELLPYYPVEPGGTIKPGDTFGFRRSKEAKDIKPAGLFDFPGTRSKTANIDFKFETVAKGDDNLVTYGAIKWSFGLRKGKVVNENVSVSDVGSPTHEAALEKHRDFYVHEPVTFYFGFDKDEPAPAEVAKIDTFLDYLRRFPEVALELTGYADLRGGRDYNIGLARRRSNGVAQALLRKGVDAGRIRLMPPAGETTEFTSDVKSPAEQDRDALRRANRRVTLTFRHTASVSP